MGLFDRLFVGSTSAQARKAELRGDLVEAIELWTRAGKPDCAARLMLLRGDSDPDPRSRLQQYMQAIATAPPASTVARDARKKRACFILAMAGEAAVSAATRQDLAVAAKELEELGEAERAAEAYALLRDIEGEARALAQAGEVDRLEGLLSAEERRERQERALSRTYAEIESLTKTGLRREALSAAEQLAREAPQESAAREAANALRAQRLTAGISRVLVSGRPMNLLLDKEVVIGRTEGSLVVPSAALSRRHLALERSGDGAIVRDLGSRNGTLLRGARLAGPLPVGSGLSLLLGGEVKLEVSPSSELAGGWAVRVGGEDYIATFGAARLPFGGWTLDRAADGWVELIAEGGQPVFRGEMAMATRMTLMRGDRLSLTRGSPPSLEILA